MAKTQFLLDKAGIEIRVGDIVRTFLGGGYVKLKVLRLRPRKRQVVLSKGEWYKDAVEVEKILEA